jgi:glutathione synthase/RimK-type ligase-like ATP-grasp enzyme
MQQKKILIITHSNDNESVEHVSSFIREAGLEVIRFNVDLYPVNSALSSTYTKEGWKTSLRIGDELLFLEDLRAVWYRRAFGLGTGLNKQVDAAYLSVAMGEVRHTLIGMIEGLDCFKLARPSHYRRLDSKEEQLKVAHRCGLLIPPTCISNDPQLINEFIEETGYPLITKMQTAFSLRRDGKEQVVYTNELRPGHLSTLQSIRFCPMIIQKKIEKAFELRVTIVNDAVFAFSIDSQKEEGAKVDWRKEGVKLLKDWQPFNLPQEIENSLLQLMRELELYYGAIDLVCTPEGEYYFLEVNAAGEFFWLDRLCDHAISRKISEVLLNPPVA